MFAKLSWMLVICYIIEDVTSNKCDDCFTQWKAKVFDLRSTSEDVVKRASAVNQKIINQLGVIKKPNESDRLYLTYDADDNNNFAALDAKLDAIGPMALTTKRRGDQIKLFHEDLSATQKNIEHLDSQANDTMNLISLNKPRLDLLQVYIQNNDNRLTNLKQLVDDVYRENIIKTQILTPKGSVKLIQDSRTKSLEVINKTMAFQEDFLSGQDVSLSYITQQVGFLQAKRNLFDSITLGMVRNVFKNKGLNFSIEKNTLNLLAVESPLVQEVKNKIDRAKNLAKEIRIIIGQHESETNEQLLAEINIYKNHIIKANEIFDVIGKSLGRMNIIMTELQSVMDQKDKRNHVVNSSEIMMNASHVLESISDTIGTYWTYAMGELEIFKLRAEDGKKIFDQVDDINIMISEILAINQERMNNFHEKYYDDLYEIEALMKSCASINVNLTKLSESVSKIENMRSEINHYVEQKMHLNQVIDNDRKMISWLLFGSISSGEKISIRYHDRNNLNEQAINLRDRLAKGYKSILSNYMVTNQAFDNNAINLKELDTINETYLKEILSRKTELISLIKTLIDDNTPKSSRIIMEKLSESRRFSKDDSTGRSIHLENLNDDSVGREINEVGKLRVMKLYNKKRIHHLRANYQVLYDQLFDMLVKTSNLHDEFESDHKQLNLYKKYIESYEAEIDKLSDDMDGLTNVDSDQLCEDSK